MRRSSRLPVAPLALGLALAGWSLAGCASPGAKRIVGPDGSPMAHVRCGSDQGECFRLAGELCPSGYEIKPVLTGNDGNFLVRCRSTALVASAPVCPAPALALPAPVVSSGALTARGASNSGWPPASEPWPDAYPWPAPETTIGVQVPPAPTGGELDLGY